jgi:hypothetical protein
MNRKPNSRTSKIHFLKNLQQGRAKISELIPYKIEFWKQFADEPDTYINEETNQEISAGEMEIKEKTKGHNVLFTTILNKSRHE